MKPPQTTAHPLLAAFAVLALGPSLATPTPAASQQDPDLLTAHDVFDLEYVADPQISPDGERIVFVRRWADVNTDRRYSNLWIMDRDGDDPAAPHHGQEARTAGLGGRPAGTGSCTSPTPSAREQKVPRPALAARLSSTSGGWTAATRPASPTRPAAPGSRRGRPTARRSRSRRSCPIPDFS